MLLDDPLDCLRIAPTVPNAFGHHGDDRSTAANAIALCFDSKNSAAVTELQFFQPRLQVFPGLFHLRTAGALRRSGVHAHQDGAGALVNAEFFTLLFGCIEAWICQNGSAFLVNGIDGDTLENRLGQPARV